MTEELLFSGNLLFFKRSHKRRAPPHRVSYGLILSVLVNEFVLYQVGLTLVAALLTC